MWRSDAGEAEEKKRKHMPDFSANDRPREMAANSEPAQPILTECSSVEKDQQLHCSSVHPEETRISRLNVSSVGAGKNISKDPTNLSKPITTDKDIFDPKEHCIEEAEGKALLIICKTDPDETIIKKEYQEGEANFCNVKEVEVEVEEYPFKIDKTDIEDSENNVVEDSVDFSSDSSNFDVVMPDFESSNDSREPENSAPLGIPSTSKKATFSQLDFCKEKVQLGSCDITLDQNTTTQINKLNNSSKSVEEHKNDCNNKTFKDLLGNKNETTQVSGVCSEIISKKGSSLVKSSASKFDNPEVERDKTPKDINEMEISSTSDCTDSEHDMLRKNVSVIQYIPNGCSVPNQLKLNISNDEAQVVSQSESHFGETLKIPIESDDLNNPSVASSSKVERSSIADLLLSKSEQQCTTNLPEDDTLRNIQSPNMNDFHLQYSSDTESEASPAAASLGFPSENSISDFQTNDFEESGNVSEKLENAAIKLTDVAKIIKIVTVTGKVHYLKISQNFVPKQTTKFASPEKENSSDEEVTCKGCDLMLKKPNEYHQCVENFCRFCQNQLLNKEKFELHTIESHLKVGQKTCPFCDTSLESVQLLETHLLSHTSLRLAPSVCVSCKKAFRTNEGRIHHECRSVQLVCKKCNVTFTSKEKLDHHSATQHKHAQQTSRVIDPVQAVLDAMTQVNLSADDKYQCDICDVVFVTKPELESHRRWHFEECGEIPKSTSSQLSDPKSEKDKSGTCEDTSCKNSDNQISELLFCKYCIRHFNGKLRYELHMVQYHSTEKLCQFCEKEFRHAKDLVVHVEKYHTKIVFQPSVCFNCNSQFNKADYLKHNSCQKYTQKKDKSTIELNFECDVCKIYFQNDISRENHAIKHHAVNDSCPFCPDTFSNSKDLINHVVAHENVQNTIFKCQLCKFSSSSQNDLKEHPCAAKVVELHEAKICPYCKKLFDDQNQFEMHMITNHESCQICHENFESSTSLLEHLKIHTNNTNIEKSVPQHNKKNSCALCIASFETLADFNTHLVTKHTSYNSCNFCSEKFSLRRELVGHLKFHNEISGGNAIPKKKNAVKIATDKICKICNVKFLKQKFFENHMMEEHSSKDVCQFCGKAMRSTDALIHHLANHTKLPYKPHKCKNCGESYSKAQHLYHHACSLICKTCSETFQSNRELLEHKNTMHCFRCELCSREFSCEKFLTQHIKTHEEVKGVTRKNKFKSLQDSSEHDLHDKSKSVPKVNLQCPYCNKRFASNKKLIVHMKNHDESTDLCCKICNSKFDDKDTYNRHKLEEHSVREKCELCDRSFNSQIDLISHIQINHNKNVSLKCATCKNSFSSEKDFHDHTCSEYECNFCHKVFRNSTKFKKHSVENHVKRIPCKFCKNVTFASPFLLAFHYVSDHSISDFLQIHCAMCCMQFHSQNMLKIHVCPMLKRLMEVPNIIYSDEAAKLLDTRMFSQRENTVTIKTEPIDDVDTESLSTNFQDDSECGSSSTPSSFQVQELKVEAQDDRLMCIHCDQSFVSKAAMNKHLLQEKFCKFCTRIFKNDHAFGSHMIYKHCKSVVCGFCDKTFESTTALKSHCLIHTKVEVLERNFYCVFCLIPLTTKAKFEKHMLDKHCNSSNICPFCQQSFGDTNKLQDHLKTHRSLTLKPQNTKESIAQRKSTELSHFSKKNSGEPLREKETSNSCALKKNITIGEAEQIVPRLTKSGRLNPTATKISSVKSKYEENNSGVQQNKSVDNVCGPESVENNEESSTVKRTCQDKTAKLHYQDLISTENSKEKEANTLAKEITNNLVDTAKKHCSICKKTFVQRKVFDEHMMQEHILHLTCQFCGLKFKHRNNLNSHFQVHTTSIPPSFYKCEKCKNSFNLKSQLKRHACISTKANIASGTDRQTSSKLLKKRKTNTITPSMETMKRKLRETKELHEEANIKCLLCTKTFKTEIEKVKHLKVHHRVDPNSLNHLCEKSSENSSVAAGPSSFQEEEFPCAHCEVLFSSHTLLRIHGKEVQVYCDFCRCTFPSTQLFQCHMLEKHAMERTCQFCGAQFVNKTGLQIHLQKHTNMEPLFFKCFDCGEKFKTEQDKLNHPCKAWTCHMCNTAFPSEDALVMHECSTSLCEYCQETFSSGSLLLAHVKSNHFNDQVSTTSRKRKLNLPTESLPMRPRVSDKEKGVEEEVEKFPCVDHCSKVFLTKAALNKHVQTISFECANCKELFKTSSECEDHRRKQHWLQCEFCDKKFQTKQNLGCHIRVHKSEKPVSKKRAIDASVEPPIAKRTRRTAPKSSVTQTSSVSAVNSSAEHLTTWPCDMCGKTLSSKHALALHKSKPCYFQCEICTRGFKSAAKFSAHIRLHPPPPDDFSSDEDDIVVLHEISAGSGEEQYVML